MPDTTEQQRHTALPFYIDVVTRHLEEERDKCLEAIGDDILATGSRRSTADAVRIEGRLDEASRLDLRIEQLTRRKVATVTSEPPVYRRGDVERSFFLDVYSAKRNSADALERLHRNSRMQAEKRAVDLNTSAGTGGEFAPPAWVLDEWINLARPGRVTADLIGARPLPPGISSLNIPKLTGGAGTAVQTQGNAVQDTAATTSSVASSILTVAGKQTVSRILVDTAGIPLDEFIVRELALSYGASLNSQVLTAAASAPWNGGGLLNVSGAGAVTYTQASPAAFGAGGFYSNLLKALSTVATTRDLPATAVVMHPRRWYWLAAAFDSQNRPGIVPKGNSGLHIADQANINATGNGPVGDVAGVPVYLDASIPTNLGAGTNQDAVVVLRESDLFLWERAAEGMSFEAADAPNLDILFRVHGFAALIANAQPASICTVQGTGLVTPTIA